MGGVVTKIDFFFSQNFLIIGKIGTNKIKEFLKENFFNVKIIKGNPDNQIKITNSY